MTFKNIFCLAGMLFPLGLVAQEASDVTLCDFETTDSYKSVGVYDTWAESPFRTGVLTGNARVVNNHLNEVDELLGYAPNESSKILGVQRSRYGSNTFGALIELKEPFAVKDSTYVHIKINTPKESKIMLIGLGNRDDRPGQSALTEQFWSTSTSKVVADHWVDAVFATSGAKGITIRNLLVVVDRSSTHDLTADFAAYIDDIVLSKQSTPFFSSTLYPINYDESQAHTRGTQRYTASISLNSSDGSQSINVNQAEEGLLYIKRLNDCFYAKAGEKVTSGFTGSMSWMAGYVYIDQDNNGKFDVTYTADAVTDAKDLMSYSQYNGYDSDGNAVSGEPALNPPSYTIPADIKPGIYRMRYKVDWNCVDPGGNTSSANAITSNGGVIVDTRINIHDTQVTVSRTTDELGGGGLNGDILLEDGTPINDNKVPFGQDLVVKVDPAPGFRFNYVVMRHGYNLEGDSLVSQNLQWKEEIIRARAFNNNTYTIPASKVDGDILFIPYFSSTSGDNTGKGDEYALNFDPSLPMSDATSNVLNSVKFTVNSKSTSTTLKVGNSDATTVYRNLTPKEVAALKGSSITTTISYKGKAVNSYLYLDMNRDGYFTTELNDDGSVTDNSELIAYSFYNNHNSKGETASAEGAGYSLPIFQVPADLPSGMYRARLKLDVNNIDPAGNWAEGVSGGINENGGIVVDFLMNIHDETVNVEANSENGSLVGRGNTGIPQTTAIRTAYSVLPVAPADGYVLDSLVIRHGYNLDGEQYPHGNRQWSQYTSTKGNSGKIFTIPKDTINGDVRITAYFSADGTEEYKLKFAEEFDGEDGSLPDSKFWSTPTRYSSTWNRFIAKSDEGRAATAYIKDGKLVTRCVANTFSNEGDVEMVSGAIQSSGKMNFTYGRIEGRVRTNPHSGNFPAFWMMPQDGSAGWPACGEIDIWEQINTEDKSYHTIHSKWANTLNGGPTKSGTATCTTGEYHVYALEWTSDLLTWYVNGKKVFSYAKSATASDLESGQWPFDAPFYVILNQSVGDGSWASAADVTYGYETLFDWVRIYQKDGSQMTGIDTAPSPATSQLDYYLYPGKIHLVASATTKVRICDLQGRLVFNESVQGNKSVTLPKGVYILNDHKVMVP